MSDLDITLLTRITHAAIAANPQLGARVVPILQAADSDGQANAEDRTFTEAEARAYIQRLRQSHQSTVNLFTRHRSHLAGSLSSAQSRVRGETGSESLVAFLERAAQQDAQDPMLSDAERQQRARELSAEEIDSLSQFLDQTTREGDSLSADGIMGEVRALLGVVEALEQSLPESMVPTSEQAQQASIDLNFIKHLPSGILTATDDDSRMVQNLLQMAGVDPRDAQADWSLSYAEVQAFLASLPPGETHDPVRTMADFRFIAHQIREAANQVVAQSGSQDAGLSLSVQGLIDRRALINDPSVDQILEVAGDATLTAIEVERILQLEEQRSPGFLRGMLQGAAAGQEGQSDLQRATALYMGQVQNLVERYNREVAALTPSVPEESSDRNLILSRHVLTALENMRSGFTHRDREYAERNAMVGFIDMVSYVCTLGGALTWIGAGRPTPLSSEEVAEYGSDAPRFGPTYRHVVRANVERHDAERGSALNALRQIIEHPPADFHGERTIPNALDYLRDHDDTVRVATGRGMDAGVVEGSVAPGTGQNRRYYDLLVGDYFQARRLWQIHTEADTGRQTRMWYDFAQNLRSGDAGGWWGDGTHSAGLRNTDYARAILHAVRRLSTDRSQRRQAELAFRDSMGMDILDEQGHVVTQGNGEFGMQPWLWFRNYSDESSDAVASDVVALGASIYVGGGVTSVGRQALTASGRSALGARFLGFLGQRGTQVAVTEATLGTAIEGSTAGMGIFGRAMSRLGGPAWASRLVAAREAALRTAQANGTAAEVRAAETALARARDIQGLLTAPTVGAGVEAAAPRLTGTAGRIVNAHPPVPASWAEIATGTGLRASLARGGSSVLTNISLAGIGRGFNWGLNYGIFIYGISSAVFNQTRTRVDQENLQDFNHSYDLLLGGQAMPISGSVVLPPDRPSASSDAAAGDASADSVAPDASPLFEPPADGWEPPADASADE